MSRLQRLSSFFIDEFFFKILFSCHDATVNLVRQDELTVQDGCDHGQSKDMWFKEVPEEQYQNTKCRKKHGKEVEIEGPKDGQARKHHGKDGQQVKVFMIPTQCIHHFQEYSEDDVHCVEQDGRNTHVTDTTK